MERVTVRVREVVPLIHPPSLVFYYKILTVITGNVVLVREHLSYDSELGTLFGHLAITVKKKCDNEFSLNTDDYSTSKW